MLRAADVSVLSFQWLNPIWVKSHVPEAIRKRGRRPI